MKIAVVSDTFLPQTNGVVTYLCDSLKLLSKENTVDVYAPGVTSKITNEKIENYNVNWIPSGDFPFYPGYRISSLNYGNFSKILDKNKPDILHTHAPVLLGLEGMLWAKLNKIPIVVTYHTHFPDYLPHLLNGKLPPMFNNFGKYTVKKLIKQVLKYANIVTAPTAELVTELETYGLKNVIYLPNGVDFEKFSVNSKKSVRANKTAPASRTYLGNTQKTILYVGRLSFEKKIEVLLKAYSMLDPQKYALRIVGSGPHHEKLASLANELNLKNCTFAGFVPMEQIKNEYSSADVFVSASDSETFGLTFIEAMYFGLPAVGVNKLGPKEIIEDGKNGFLVPADSEKELAVAIERIFSDRKLYAKMKKNAQKRAKIFSIEKSVQKTIYLYHSLVKHKVDQ